MSSYHYDVIVMTSSLVTLSIDLHGLLMMLGLKKLITVRSIQFFGNQFNFQGLHFEEMIIDTTYNFSCKQVIIKCNVQLSICL